VGSCRGICLSCRTVTTRTSQHQKLRRIFRSGTGGFDLTPTYVNTKMVEMPLWSERILIASKGSPDRVVAASRGGLTTADNLASVCAARQFARGIGRSTTCPFLCTEPADRGSGVAAGPLAGADITRSESVPVSASRKGSETSRPAELQRQRSFCLLGSPSSLCDVAQSPIGEARAEDSADAECRWSTSARSSRLTVVIRTSPAVGHRNGPMRLHQERISVPKSTTQEQIVGPQLDSRQRLVWIMANQQQTPPVSTAPS
jgi:hypothetical protein